MTRRDVEFWSLSADARGQTEAHQYVYHEEYNDVRRAKDAAESALAAAQAERDEARRERAAFISALQKAAWNLYSARYDEAEILRWVSRIQAVPPMPDAKLTPPPAPAPPVREGGDDRPRVVCLCGSTRFREAYAKAHYDEEHAGRIVLSVPCYKDDLCCKTADDHARLDRLHRHKIDIADEILVLNVGGYVGDSTRREIEYAKSTGKLIRWITPPAPPAARPPDPTGEPH